MKSLIRACEVRRRSSVSLESSADKSAPPHNERLQLLGDEPPNDSSLDDCLLDIRHLKVEYLTPRGPVRAVDDVSLSLKRGEVVGLAGESGSGKSTIAHAVLRILRPPAVITDGEVLFEGRDTLNMGERELEQFRWREVSIVFQSAMNALNPVMRIRDQLVDVMRQHGMSTTESNARAVKLFDLVGIEPKRL